jgi:hypothetical protein
VVQYIINKHNVKIKDIGFMQWIGVFYGISSEAFIQRLLILVFARFGCWKLIYIYIYYFVPLEEGTILRSFSVVTWKFSFRKRL